MDTAKWKVKKTLNFLRRWVTTAHIFFLIWWNAKLIAQLCLWPPPSDLKSDEECSGSILVCRLSHREPVLTHSCGVQYRNLTPEETSSSVNILYPGNPLQVLAKEVWKWGTLSNAPSLQRALERQPKRKFSKDSLSRYPWDWRGIKLTQREHPSLSKREGEVSNSNATKVGREGKKKKRKFGFFPAIRWRGKKDAWSRGAVPTRGGSGLGRRERGLERRRTNNLEREENGDPAPRTGSRPRRPCGGNFAGEDGPGSRSRGAPIAAGAQSGVIREPGGPGPAAREVWQGPTRRGALSPGCRRDPGADGIWAPCGRRLRGGGAGPPPRPLPAAVDPIGLSPAPKTGQPGRGSDAAPDGDPPTPGSPGRASPPPRPSPQPDSPREYRDLGDSRSRSALSNEMKSEGIAARPSPARGQREGGSGGGGGTSSPGPRAPNRGRQARAAAAASSSRAETSSEPRAEEKAARWRGNSTETNSRRARRGVQGGEREEESQRVRFVLLLSENWRSPPPPPPLTGIWAPPPRGALRRRGGGRPGAGKSRGGPRRAGRCAPEQQQQGLRFLPPRPGPLFPSRERAPPAGREEGWEVSAPGAPGREKVFAPTWWWRAGGGGPNAELSAGGDRPGGAEVSAGVGERPQSRDAGGGLTWGLAGEWSFVACTATTPLGFS